MSAAPFQVARAGLVLCVLSLVPDDSLYFTSLHFSSLSLRVVSHQQRKPRPPYNTALPSSLLRQISIPSPPKTLGSPCFYFPLASSFFCCFFFLRFLSAVHAAVKSVEKKCQALLVTVLPISVAKARRSPFDTVRWPGKLKTQLKWQSRGQLFCISKALLWLFYTNYIC